ncbi:transglycosylase SLT domain-containing protein [Methylobacterium platani]|uniref:Transglycosylase SLT domain protein n=2 Tax=Methylobacterium platani TaxID=427683 RepID=A0A179RUB3_9HYPH|nr:transglycosylase SLT domain-containing protein [Methylobacterium platani]KMO19177.1 transglycosylase SLT domain protein [Methylobacterium platani JCM 14648]OAS11236.1 transglycosylase SLT domain protein [Methylobacterium platani]
MRRRADGPAQRSGLRMAGIPAGAHRDVLALGGRGRAAQGGVPVMARALLAAGCLAAGLSALLHQYGTDLVTARPAVTMIMADLLVMPRPKIQAPAVPSREAAVMAPLREPVHDLDTALGSSGVDRVSYDDLLAASTGGDPNEVLSFGPMRIRRHLVQTIVRAAATVRTDPVLLMAVADKESSFLTEVQARTSSATGLYQFIERTWLQVMREFGAQHGYAREAGLIGDDNAVADAAERARILDLRRDPSLAAVMAGEMLKRDSARIAARIGRDLTLGETYLAHFLGPDDAERFMAKVVEEPKAEAAALLPKPAKANRPIFYERVGRRKARSLTVAQVHDKFEAMMSTRGARYRDVGALMGVMAYAADAP